MPIIRINQLPEGSGSLTSDDIFYVMDNPGGSAVSKQITLNTVLTQVKLNTVSSPANLPSDQNNYALSTSADIVRLSSSVSINISGFVADQNGRAIVIINVGGSEITLNHQSTNSSVNNRIICPGQVDYIINRSGGSVTIFYDAVDNKWRVL